MEPLHRPVSVRSSKIA